MPLLFCSAQDIWFNEKTGLVEATTDKAIDLSKIVSDYNDMKKSVKQKDSIIQAKNRTIEQLSNLSRKQSERVSELTDVIIEQNTRVDAISDEQVDVALGAFSRLSLSAEIKTQPQQLNAIEGYAFATFRINKFYIVGSYTVGTELSKLQAGIGYTFF